MTKLVPSRWLDIGLAFLLTSTSSRSIKTQKRAISSYLDLPSAMVSNAYVAHLTANQNTGLASSCSLARRFNLALKTLSAEYGEPLRSVLALKIGVVLVSKIQSYFCVLFGSLNQGQ